jgi:hypothetical protein
MSFLDRIAECNAHDLARFRPFLVGGARVGWVTPARAERLARFGAIFDARDDAVELDPGLATFERRSEALARVVDALEAEGAVTGRRDEFYPVTTAWEAPPLAKLERAAVPYFGMRAWGIHLTGFVRGPDGIAIWVPRRAKDRPTYPGELDNTVAGGQAIGLGFVENMVKECAEEASIPAALARRAVAVGCIAYTLETPDGLKPDMQMCFDLELPRDFTPASEDGEHESFALWPAAKVMERVATTRDFKFNCNLVLIDFFVRHGLIGPDEPDYAAICRGLRR